MASELSQAQAQERFSDYRDGALAPADREAVRAHLGACADCKREYLAFADTVSSLMKLKSEAPPNFLPAVQEAIRRRSRGRFYGKKTFWTRFPIELVSLITLLIMLVVYLFLTIAEPRKLNEGGAGPPASPGRAP